MIFSSSQQLAALSDEEVRKGPEALPSHESTLPASKGNRIEFSNLDKNKLQRAVIWKFYKSSYFYMV